MRIGIEASCWVNNRGPGRQMRELLAALLTLDRRNKYWFFLDAEMVHESADLPESVRLITIDRSQASARAIFKFRRRSLADLWLMGREVSQHFKNLDIDIFYFPAGHTFFPLWWRQKVVLTLHDKTKLSQSSASQQLSGEIALVAEDAVGCQAGRRDCHCVGNKQAGHH